MSRQRPSPQQSRRDRRAAARLDRPAKDRRSIARQPARPAWQSPVVLVSAAALVIGIALVALALPRGSGDDGELTAPLTVYEPGLASGDVLGQASAPVVMELYSDFQCPACKLFVTGQLKALTDEFVRPGTLRIEARDIAFLGRGSFDESLELAVGAACAAEQNRYWQFHDWVFWNQGRENRGDHDDAFIARIADQAQVDQAAFDACRQRSDVRQAVQSSTSTALAAGIQSTPTLVVNGQRVVGVPQYGELAALIRGFASPAPSGTAGSPAPS